MKTKLTTLAPAGTNGNTPPPRRPSNLILKADYREAEFEHWPRPKPLQLAQLAAQLAGPGETIHRVLVQRALDLYWESCRQIKEDYRTIEDYKAWEEALDAQNEETDLDPADAIPRPSRYPVTFQEIELLLLPNLKGRTGKRAELFRAYISERVVAPSRVIGETEDQRERWVGGRPPAPSPDEVADIWGRLRRRHFEEKDYVWFAGSFLSWYRSHVDQKTRAIKSENAMRGWKKRRNKKQDKLGPRP